jgi:hypothetical protein
MIKKVSYRLYTHLDDHGMWWRFGEGGRRVSSLSDKFVKVMAERFQPETENYFSASLSRPTDKEAPR